MGRTVRSAKARSDARRLRWLGSGGVAALAHGWLRRTLSGATEARSVASQSLAFSARCRRACVLPQAEAHKVTRAVFAQRIPVLRRVEHAVASRIGMASVDTRTEDAASQAAAASTSSREGGENEPPLRQAAAAAAVLSGAGSMAEADKEEERSNYQVLGLGILGAILCCLFFFVTQGAYVAAQWMSCYLIEYSLSIDNLFVFLVIFQYFQLPKELQTRVLSFGIWGAVVFRFIFIYLGATLLEQFDFLILIFAGILIYASIAGFTKDEEETPESMDENAVVRTLRGVMDISPELDGENFFTEVSGKMVATPLLLCLLVIEFSDIVFATDSVPAVLGTTQDPVIAYTSNVFALFGLRSLFFILRDAMNSFRYLGPAVNTVLGWIGVKIVVDYFHIVEVPMLLSLAVVVGILSLGVVLSIREMGDKKSNCEDAERVDRQH
eukprot:TRINITY_DN31278_c0_g1_i1.p1 TRINITY_DN31278_c0_g1~~TRINITY_DN31278_c0_g1_i1.p1  ORF type:complete len:448 (+),score=75.56 TRINITY_DN31278_c0_g1_i1:29-1345(+)